jgi:predicted PurR-regulated permease PerM
MSPRGGEGTELRSVVGSSLERHRIARVAGVSGRAFRVSGFGTRNSLHSRPTPRFNGQVKGANLALDLRTRKRPCAWSMRAGGCGGRGGVDRMSATPNTQVTWFSFAGCVLVIAVLYWAQAVLVPIALAALLTFILARPVTLLQRWVGRVPAVLLVVLLVFSVIAVAGWALATQLSHLAADLPGYRANIQQKIADVRSAGRGGSVEKVQETLDDIQKEMERTDSRGTPARPVVVRSEQVATLWAFPTWLGSMMGPLATAGLIFAMVIFMLLEREELRGRFIGLIGHGHLAITTKAFDEAGGRVSRQLLMQTVVNALYGVGVGAGLYVLGVPYPLLWATLGGALRFIPYLGPIVAAGIPILVSLAALPGWTQPLLVVGLFVLAELFTNLVLETILYAGAAGVSQVALLIAVAFWTWLWGPMGLLLATPLTVCLVVLGKNVPGLEFVATLMADRPALAPDAAYYQRLLARDQSEASDLIDRHVATQPPETVYDALLLPALNYAERDRLEGRLGADEEVVIIESTLELISDAAVLRRNAREIDPDSPDVANTEPSSGPSSRVLGYAANGTADEVALRMLGHILDPEVVTLEVVSPRALTSELIETVRERDCQIVCIADLPPSPPSKTRYVIKKLHAALPQLTIVVGRWAPPTIADDQPHLLLTVGARHVGTTLIETRDYLEQLARQTRPTHDDDATAVAIPA